MPVKILMVCLGNICRSPLAEGILASKLPNDKFLVDSAGTGSWHIGRAPDTRSITTAKKNGLNIANQKGRQFQKSDFDTFDYIFVMDSTNYRDVIHLTQNETQKQKVQLILDAIFPNENVDVPDPYYGMENGFDMVYQMLDEACEVITKRLITKHSGEN
jgi:protein-tyrosine phosphatase